MARISVNSSERRRFSICDGTPPYRMPTSKSIMRHTWEKGAQYLKKMGGIIMIASIIIWFLGYYPRHDTHESVAEQQENSYIGQIGKAIEPVIKPLGFDWKLGIGLISGVGAKELVVSTLGVLYADDPDADSVSLADEFRLLHWLLSVICCLY